MGWSEIIQREQLTRDKRLMLVMSHASNPSKETPRFVKMLDELSQ